MKEIQSYFVVGLSHTSNELSNETYLLNENLLITRLPTLMKRRCDDFSLVLSPRDQPYVIGGFDSHYNKMVKHIESYNFNTTKWEIEG
jgi:hypothetical protein